MVREPSVAGKFYPGSFERLELELKRCFENSFGPGALPVEKRQGTLRGLIVPHAGYAYSGPCAAWGYKELAEADPADLFIVIGPNHTGIGKSSTMLDDWRTPLGLFRLDKPFASKLAENSELKLDSRPFSMEHSIEVQLPFIQFAEKRRLNELSFVPIVLSNELDIRRFALDLKEAIMEYGRRVCIVASSDFTHYGPAYGYMPFESEREKKLYALDSKAIGFIKAQDAKGFLDFTNETGATICGRIAIAVLLLTLPKTQISCLQYYTSGDVLNDYKNAVGYAAISLK
jgi:MEMO1 family protein